MQNKRDQAMDNDLHYLFIFCGGGKIKSKRSNSHEAVIALVLLLEEMVFLEIRLINKTAQKKKTPSANL